MKCFFYNCSTVSLFSLSQCLLGPPMDARCAKTCPIFPRLSKGRGMGPSGDAHACCIPRHVRQRSLGGVSAVLCRLLAHLALQFASFVARRPLGYRRATTRGDNDASPVTLQCKGAGCAYCQQPCPHSPNCTHILTQMFLPVIERARERWVRAAADATLPEAHENAPRHAVPYLLARMREHATAVALTRVSGQPSH